MKELTVKAHTVVSEDCNKDKKESEHCIVKKRKSLFHLLRKGVSGIG